MHNGGVFCTLGRRAVPSLYEFVLQPHAGSLDVSHSSVNSEECMLMADNKEMKDTLTVK